MRIAKTLMVSMALVALAVTASGCGKKSNFKLVRDVGVKSYVQDGNAFGQVLFVLDTGNVVLPAITLPILDPRHPATNYGSMAIRPRLDKLSELQIDLNLSQVAHVPGAGAALPNGNPLPIGGLQDYQVLSLPVGGSGVQVYVAIDARLVNQGASAIAMVGVAVPFKEMNSIGSNLGKADIFAAFSFSKVNGLAGIFTGANPGQTGLALFVDASELVSGANKAVALAQAKSMSLSGASAMSIASVYNQSIAAASVAKPNLVFFNMSPGKKKEDKINNALYNMSQRRTRFHLN